MRVLLELFRSSMGLYNPVTAIVVTQLSSLTSFLELIASVIIISLLVHEDPAVGRDAFWLTRPIDAGSLSSAKLGLGLAALVVLPLVGDLSILGIFHATTREMARAVPLIVVSRLTTVLPLFLAAALTPSLARLAVLVVAVAGAFVLFVAVATTTVLMFMEIGEGSPRPDVMNPTPDTISTLVLIAVSVAVIRYQYARRRLKRAVAFAAAGLTASAMFAMFWPWRAVPPAPDPGTWAHDTARTNALLDSDAPYLADRMSFARRDRPAKQVAVHLTLSGIPDDFSLYRTEARSRFDVAGTTLTSKSSGPVPVPRSDPRVLPADVRPLQSSLGVARISGRSGEGQYEMWPVVLTVTEDEFARYARTPGRLTAEVDFHVQRHGVSAVSPLRPGPFFTDAGHRVEITRIEQRPDSCTVFLRDVALGALFTSRVQRMEEIVLRNPVRREALRGDQRWPEVGGGSPASLLLNVSLGWFSGNGASSQHGYSVREYTVRYPAQGTTQPVLDPAWLANAELVRVTAEYAGYISRSVTMDGFQMVR
jgi:hypothetical protein